MAGLGSLFIDLLARTGKFETDIGRAARVAEKRAKEIDRSFKRLGSRITGALGGIAAGFSLGAIITETANAEKALAALDNAVKNNAGAAGLSTRELSDMSSELQRLTTYADDSIQGMQSLLLTFRQISEPEFKRAQVAVLDLATALGRDLNSSALLVGRALADPEKGMKQLARAGVVLSESQQDLIKNLTATGKVSEAQAALLSQLEARFGGAAKAAKNTLGGAIEGLKNSFGDLLEAESGVSALTKSVNELSDVLSDPKTKEGVDAILGAIARGAANLAQTIAAVGNAFKWFFENSDKWHPLFQGINYARKELDFFLSDVDLLKDQIRFLEEQRDTIPLVFTLGFSNLNPDSFLGVLTKGDIAKRIQEMNRELARLQYDPNQSSGPKNPRRRSAAVEAAPSEEFEKLSSKLQEQIALYGKVGKAAEVSYQIQSGALDELSGKEQQQLLALARRYDAIVASVDAEKKLSEEQKKAVEEITKMTQSLEQQVATFGMGETATIAYRVAHGDLALAFQQAGADGAALKDKLLDLTLELEVMTDAANGAAEAISDFAQQNSESLNQSLEAFEADFEERFIKGVDKLTAYQEQAARNTQDIIADTLLSGFDKGVDGILKSFGDMIVKLVGQAVAADIAGKLFGAAGGGTGGGWVGMAAGWLGGLAGNRAIGGPVLAGMNYHVNEREPEFFRPRVGGDIIPLSKMPNMGGGMSLTQHFTVKPETGERVTRRTEQQIAAAASRGLAMASRRNN
jgi:hypothetical protein